MRVPLHAAPDIWPTPLLGVVTIAALGAALLFWVAVAAFIQRRSRPYLLLAAAFAALLSRPLVTGVDMVGLISPEAHHLFEHGIDVVLVSLVVGAVYYARTARKEVTQS